MNNKQWAEKILQKYDPLFKHRWEIYNDTIKNLLSTQNVWIDCGCGNNGTIKALGHLAKIAIGTDIINNNQKENFVISDIRYLPFSSDCADLISLRFVAEHFENIDEYFRELLRVTKKGGNILILTTNLLSPLIFLPRLFLPYWLKSKILTKLFKVKDQDVFPTYHKLNTPNQFKKLKKDFIINKMVFISDLNYTRKWIFILLLIWHKATALKIFYKFRTNMLIILEKK